MNAQPSYLKILAAESPKRARRRAKRRRARPLVAGCELIACDLQGRKFLGQATHRWNGSACAKALHAADAEPDADGHAQPASSDRSAMVQRRLEALLEQREIDLCYLRFIAGWSQAELARERRVHRSTIKRQEVRVFAVLRSDPLLRWLVALPPFPPEANVQQRAHLYEGAADSEPLAAGRNGKRQRIAA